MIDEEAFNIKKDIEKSGFPLEIELSNLLRNNGWGVAHQAYFYDSEEGKSRALDIIASRLETFTSSKFDRLTVGLFIECKRIMDKPWVFYTIPKGEDHAPDIGPLFFVKFYSLPELEPREYRLLQFTHLFVENIPRIATISYEPFSLGKTKRVFTATNQVLKALAYKKKTGKDLLGKFTSIIKGAVHILYPLIVLDGKIYKCETSADGIEVSPVDYVQYQISHGVSGELGKEETYLVEIMRKDFLTTYLGWLDNEIKKMVQFASENL